jgi:hypothetical protein
MVKYWRKNSIKIVMYLDDGFGIGQNFEDCINHSQFVKDSLTKAGFLINEKKNHFLLQLFYGMPVNLVLKFQIGE